MPVYKIVFSNNEPARLGAEDEAQDFVYHIDAASTDEALGLAELEFKQKHPQQLHSSYHARVSPGVDVTGGRVQHFDLNAPLNPDQ